MKKSIAIFIFCAGILVSNVAAAQKTVHLIFKPSKADYSDEMQQALQSLADNGGGTLVVPYGKYPLLKPVVVKNELKAVHVAIKGQSNTKGEKPLFFDTRAGEVHSFFIFWGHISNPTLRFTVDNISILGNNPVYTDKHPFIRKHIFSIGIQGQNVASGIVKNVNIENMYGTAVLFANGYANSGKKYRINNPQVLNCRIINCWGWRDADDSGDGVMFWQCMKPVIENCTIRNNINYTKHIGRCGVVLENNTEQAVVRNNIIEGYDRGIHSECDYGGHLIEKNSFGLNKNGITLSYDCHQDIRNKKEYRPIVIRSNTFRYNQDFERNDIRRNDFGYIYIYKPSVVLNGLTIANNKFITNNSKQKVTLTQKANKAMGTSLKNYFWLSDQKEVVISGNQYF